MAIDKIKVGWSTGGRIVFGSNPFYFDKEWTEFDGVSDQFEMNVLMTGGDISTTRTPVVETMASIGEVDNSASRVKVLFADGIQAISGNISFDCDKSNLKSLIEWIFQKRKRSMSIYIGTEDFNYYKLTSCMWTNITIASAEASVVNCSIAFVSNREPERLTTNIPFFDPLFKESNIIPYWQTGAINSVDGSDVILNVSSWELGIVQNITPAYLNSKDFDLPAYFRVANWEFNLNGTILLKKKSNTEAYENKFTKIQIGVTETNDPIILEAKEYVAISATAAFGGIDEMGSYTYTLDLVGIPTAYNNTASDNEPFTLTFT